MREILFLEMIFIFIIFLLFNCCNSQFNLKNDELYIDSGNFISNKIDNSIFYFYYENLIVKISIINNNLFYIQAVFSNFINDIYSYSVVKKEINTNIIYEEFKDCFIIYNSINKLKIMKSKFMFEFYDDNNLLLTSLFKKNMKEEEFIVYSKYNNDRFFGLGEKSGDFELTGRSFIMYNTDSYKYTTNTDPLYVSIPFYISLNKNGEYGIFYDNPAKSFFSFKKNNYCYKVNDNRIEMYIIPGNVFRIIQDYVVLTGKPNLPPLWAFGYHQSRYSYQNQKEVLSICENFKKYDLPLDAIYLDIGFMDRNMSFTYDSNKFPNPLEMNNKLKLKGIKTVAIVDPGIKIDSNYSVYLSGLNNDVFLYYKNKYYRGSVWPGMCVFPDFTKFETIEWWGLLYTNLTSYEIEGFWNDMNEPTVFSTPNMTLPDYVEMNNFGDKKFHKYLHNIYGFSMVKASYLGLLKIFSNKRIFLLSRSGYSGIQRYAFLWTGDNTSNWDHLKMNLYMVMNLGLSGVQFSGADIGGYTGSPDDELFTRWIQLGVFMPFMRNHTEQGTKMQEPYNFKKYFNIIKKYIKLRYKILPYLYYHVFRAYMYGLPIIKPLFFYDKKFIDVKNQFIFGDDILVIPVFQSNINKLKVVIPDGMWYDFWNNNIVYEGVYEKDISIDNIPVYIRAGSIIPFYYNELNNTENIGQDYIIILNIYTNKSGLATGYLYEDDGKSLNYKNYDYLLSTFKITQSNNIGKINILKFGSYQIKRNLIFNLPSNILKVEVYITNIYSSTNFHYLYDIYDNKIIVN